MDRRHMGLLCVYGNVDSKTGSLKSMLATLVMVSDLALKQNGRFADLPYLPVSEQP